MEIKKLVTYSFARNVGAADRVFRVQPGSTRSTRTTEQMCYAWSRSPQEELMPRVVHFEIHAADPDRAAAFYRTVFGWEIKRWGEQPYWLVSTGPDERPGINGGLLPRRGAGPAEGQAVNAYVCTIEVEALDEYLGRALEAGGTLALPKMPIPGMGWLAYCKDPDGNIFGLMQPDPQAA